MQEGLKNCHHRMKLLRLRLPSSMRRRASCVDQCSQDRHFSFGNMILGFEIVQLLFERLARVNFEKLGSAVENRSHSNGCENAQIVA